jgi:hypothetical protein
MSHYTSKGLAATIISTAIVLIMALSLVIMGKLGLLQFNDEAIKVTKNMEANTKLFSLVYSTKDGESLDVLIAKSVAADSENEDLKNFIKVKLDDMKKEAGTNNYRFYVTFAGKKYFETEYSSSLSSTSQSPSTVLIAVPYNSKALTAQVSLIEW